MAIVFCGTHSIATASTDPGQAILTGRAGVGIITNDAIVFSVLSAESRCRIAASGKEAVALVGACDFIGRDAHTDLACFAIGAEVGVVAGGVVRLYRIRTEAGFRITNTDLMAII